MFFNKDRDFFAGKVAWMTGASSGIGEALSLQLAGLGVSLILSARHVDRLEKVRSAILQAGGEAKMLPLDLEDWHQLRIKAEEAVGLYGKIDLLINCAGVAIRDFALNTSLEIDDKIMGVNYFGPIALTKAVIPHMMNQGHGHIVVISSLSGKYGVPRTASYAASKHALHGFFETLRTEVDPKIIPITIIVPGLIKTGITAHAYKGDGSTFGKMEKTFESAYPVDQAARKITQAIRRRKEERFVGGMEGLTLLIHRISPWLLRRIIRNHPIKKIRKLTSHLPFRKKRA